MINRHPPALRALGRRSGYHHLGARENAKGVSASRGQQILFLGFPLTVGMSVSEVVAQAFACPEAERPVNTTFINPYSFYVLRRDRTYKRNIERFRYILPDGVGITWGLRLVHGCRTERISFDTTSLALPVLRRAQQEDRTVMLIGGRPGVACHAARRLCEAIPGLPVVATLDGYRNFEDYLTVVQSTKPDVIVCGLGVPLQEDFLVRVADSGVWKGLGYTCGGYFDQLGNGLQYYPDLVNRLNVRWLYRMVMEPRRLSRRYLIEYQSYLAALASEAWHRRR